MGILTRCPHAPDCTGLNVMLLPTTSESGAAITALLIDSTDAYERLAEDFGAEGMKGLEEEFGADAARADACTSRTPSRVSHTQGRSHSCRCESTCSSS